MQTYLKSDRLFDEAATNVNARHRKDKYYRI